MKAGMARQKVPGGKLLVVKLKYDEKIEQLMIEGDFFIFPEDALPYLEDAVVGIRADADEETISNLIRNSAESRNIELVGINPDEIARTIRMAIKNPLQTT